MAHSWQGTGESGVHNPIAKDRYFEELGDDALSVVVKHSCDLFDCSEPGLVQLRQGKSWRGMYHIDNKEVQLSHNYMGLVIHEVAHHIHRQQYPNQSRHIHHEQRFYSILQALHDFWR